MKRNKTIDAYNDCLEEMGQNAYKGYSTSSDDEESEEELEKKDEEELEKKPVKDEELDEEARNQKMLDAAIIKQPHIISARSNIRFFWDTIIIFFAIVNGIGLPLEIAFNDMIDDLEWYSIIDKITTCVFVFDIIFGFFTSYVNISSGDEIFGMRMIAVNYITNGSFIIDLLSTVPLDAFSGALGGSPGV